MRSSEGLMNNSTPKKPQYRVFEKTRSPSDGEVTQTTETATASPSDRVLERGIHIGDWTIVVLHGSIANAAEVDQISGRLGIAPPEMPFPRNALVLKHNPSGFAYCFDGTRALESVDGVNAAFRRRGIDCGVEAELVKPQERQRSRSENGGIQVAYAQEWGKSRQQYQTETSAATAQQSSSSSKITTAKQYDWTYSSTWPGMPGADEPPSLQETERVKNGEWENIFRLATDPARDRIPVERLGPGSGEPILFYDEVMLYEDELGDNGSSMLNVKVRVMPQEFLVLQRFFLRVDDVMFRVFDTRMYCSFNPWDGESVQAQGQDSDAMGKALPATYPRIIRECRGSEAAYADVKRCLVPHRAHDLSQLTNVNWVAETLERLQTQKFQNTFKSDPKTASNLVEPAQLPGSQQMKSAKILGEVMDT
ncbi:Tap42 interacting protein [Malassezia psittaci]|uniref:Tap42 interacting protein n=1 Tax=Malassezia psittaci TaxID=1821823 RepID=A0AAF0FCL3_9BASI|nr:Tap42 interacting protein [Malassezia psittaci]